MKRIIAQFKPRRRPQPLALAAFACIGSVTAFAVAGAVWEHCRVAALRAQIEQIVEADKGNAQPVAFRRIAPYDASARRFLLERSAGWAPMLRTLENASMIGVTPSSVEFSAADGAAQVELNYSDSGALFDYLGRINENVSPGEGVSRWTLLETRLQANAAPSAQVIGAGMQTMNVSQSTASIRSVWQEPISSPPMVAH